MDILAHMLWTNYGARPLNKKLTKNKQKPIPVIKAMLWSIFPDMFAFGIPIVIVLFISLSTDVFNLNTLLDHHSASSSFIIDLPAYLYQFSHSLVIWALVFTLVWIIWRKPQLVLLGWAFHICLDIFSHSADFYPTPIFFPISDYHFLYGIRWSNPYFMIINYSLIVGVGLYFYLTRNKNV